jgi:hypothetical protein
MTDEDALRLLVITTAFGQCGAHYINGTDGAIPDKEMGYRGRSLTIAEDLTDKGLAIHAALVPGTHTRCRGRFAAVGGYAFQPGTQRLENLKKYREELAAKSPRPANPPSFDGTGLYPRRDSNTAIYLGEDCRGRRHFDCIHFVNWVLNTALKATRFKFSIANYEHGAAGGHVHTGSELASDVKPADILTRLPKEGRQHIGFATGAGHVVHASGRSSGVTTKGFHPGDWTARVRLTLKMGG